MSLTSLPPEILLHLCKSVTYLDLPDLTQLASLSPVFATVASDPALHRLRIWVVAPSRLGHFLCLGTLRPRVGDLIQRGVMRGPSMERRWRDGLYLYSPQSVSFYWHSQRLDRMHVSHAISALLAARPAADPAHARRTARVVLPDVGALPISHVLLPIIHRLQWCLRRDRLAKVYRPESGTNSIMSHAHLYPEHERVRLAICPGVRQLRTVFERAL